MSPRSGSRDLVVDDLASNATPRKHIFDPAKPVTCHCISRCVRRSLPSVMEGASLAAFIAEVDAAGRVKSEDKRGVVAPSTPTPLAELDLALLESARGAGDARLRWRARPRRRADGSSLRWRRSSRERRDAWQRSARRRTQASRRNRRTVSGSHDEQRQNGERTSERLRDGCARAVTF